MTLYMLGHLLKDERLSKFDNTHAILTRNVTGLSLLERKKSNLGEVLAFVLMLVKLHPISQFEMPYKM